ncbi:hypothetical protein FPV67DRAFT_1155952 [Lyophyllum atratum]|nr:hypothetical protein FPV67DRAFT_1155952 [Lyophyllum atratum]
MKYSQVILVACVGGASLAFAMPAGDNHRTPIPKSRYGKVIGKASVIADTFAKTATGNNYPVNEYSDSTSGTLKKRATEYDHHPLPGLHRQALKAADAYRKKEMRIEAASAALAKITGSVSNLFKKKPRPSSPLPDGREPISISSREFEDDLEARQLHRFRGNYFAELRKKKEAAKATAVAGVYSNAVAAPAVYSNAVTAPAVYRNTVAAPAAYKREFLHELDARDVADYLEARGTFLHALGALKDTITRKTRVSMMPVADPYAPVARDLSEDVDARDVGLDSRDFDFEIDELD